MKGASPRHGDAANEDEYGDRADDQKEQRINVSKDLPHHRRSRVDRSTGPPSTPIYGSTQEDECRATVSGIVNKTFQQRRFVPPDEAVHAHPSRTHNPRVEDGG
jgi:hypothetical protein